MSNYKYAWSNNAGYINFERLIVEDTALSGSAWSKNVGWIKFDATNGGVSNNNGDLSGYAWGDQLGWINFNNVSINTTTGKFSGTAVGDIIGTITFDCPTYCDVRTDWRPANNSQQNNGGGGGSSGTVLTTPIPPTSPTSPTNPFNPTSSNPSLPEEQTPKNQPLINTNTPENGRTNQNSSTSRNEPTNVISSQDIITEFYQSIEREEPNIRLENNHVESYNAPLNIEPTQTGLLVWDFSTPEMVSEEKREAVIIELPRNIAPSEITLSVEQVKEENLISKGRIKLLGTIFNVTAHDDTGKSIREFLDDLKITLVVPEELRGRNDLGVYYLADGATEWTLVPNAVFDNTSATFYVNHLTNFAILALDNNVISSNGGLPVTIPSSSTNPTFNLLWILILAFSAFMLILFEIRKKSKKQKY
ncbi:MAG: hypothetical protein WCX30_00175 [Candidatus Paceibacterota bacterium]